MLGYLGNPYSGLISIQQSLNVCQVGGADFLNYESDFKIRWNLT